MVRTNLRQRLHQRRQQLSSTACLQASTAICQRIQTLALIQPNQKIALYKAYGNEVDLTLLIPYLQTLGAEVYMPVLPPSGRILSFSTLSADGYWRKNIFGIEEWLGAPQLPPQAMDLVFTPVLGFDEQGNRLGQGGGYYDASFAFLHQALFEKPLLLGVAFDCQKMDDLPVEAWDVPLQAVITETTCYSRSPIM